jgi:hypothetical protein
MRRAGAADMCAGHRVHHRGHDASRGRDFGKHARSVSDY